MAVLSRSGGRSFSGDGVAGKTAEALKGGGVSFDGDGNNECVKSLGRYSSILSGVTEYPVVYFWEWVFDVWW